MTVHYLNSKGEKKTINGVVQLKNTDNTIFVALLESGVELKLRVSGIEGILRETSTDLPNPAQNQSFKKKIPHKLRIHLGNFCKGNTGPGGWGAVILFDGYEKELSGGEESTTKNRMELTAAIEALNYITASSEITLASNSKYLLDAMKKGWIFKWQKNNWKKADKKTVANVELWERFYELLKKHKVNLISIKGSTAREYTMRCEKLAEKQAQIFTSKS